MLRRRIVISAALLWLSLPAAAPAAGGRISGPSSQLPPGWEPKTPLNSVALPGRVVFRLTADGLPADRAITSALPAGAMVRPMFPRAMADRNRTSVDIGSFYVAEYTSAEDPFAVAAELSAAPGVAYAEPSFIYPLERDPAYTPNDPQLASQYGLAKIQATAAWDLTQGDTAVVIGIVDSGVEVTHPDLSGNIWINPGEDGPDGLGGNKRTNAVDDDGNGYVDDWRGWDFGGANYTNIVPDNNPSPTAANNEHGTHVAGIASASTDNGVGVAGTGFRCRLLAVKTSADNDTRGPGGVAYILAGYEGIAYAAAMGADVVNCSWGGTGGSQTEQELIRYATELGTLVVAAAGNNSSSSPFYPASYEGVLSVAATSSTDVRASFSNYGQTVDVCAPGVSILSTIFPSTYTSGYSGTSMASPFAAGLAGLVKARFPSLSGMQLGEQVRVTADSIDALNPTYRGLLGKGRINAQRALTLSLPSVRAARMTVRDSVGGDNDGNPEPNETIDIVFTFTNYLAPSAGATATLSTTTGGLTVTTPSVPLGPLGTLDTIRTTAQPFRIAIGGAVAPGVVATLKLTVTEGSLTDVQYFSVVVNPTYQTHALNQVTVTLTNNGRIGYNNFPTNTQGQGFVYPAGGGNHLFEGGLILGTSATKLVNNTRNPAGGQDNDFQARSPYQFQTPGAVSAQDGSTTFSDSLAPLTNRIGLRVNQFSYVFGEPEHDDYVILRYDITNLTGTAVTGLYAGQFFDWDVANYATNRTGYDAARSLGYTWDQNTPTAPYIGMRALDSAASVRGLVNSSLTVDRAAKWAWISGGTAQATAGPGDMHNVISSGPYTIQPGATIRLGFAIVGGAGLAGLQQNADNARAKWDQILLLVPVPGPEEPLPQEVALRQNFPNPFNPSTVIRFALPAAAQVDLRVYDLLGREVAVLTSGLRPAGVHEAAFNAAGLASGVYLYRLTAGGVVRTARMMVLK
jgi:subtilisin family serine protease